MRMMILKKSNLNKLQKVMSDPVLWIENFVQIPNKMGELVPFKLHELQLDFMRNKDKFNCLIKSRQLGFSTLSLAICLYNVCTKSNIECLIVSYDLKSADSLFERLKIMYNTIPDVIKPKAINNNKKELKLINNSRIICTTAGNKDLGRGSTYTWIHLSEFGFWKDNSDKQLLALEQALTPNGNLVIESTPNGLNHLYNIYLKAKNHENLYHPFFYNWYENKSMFQNEYEDYTQRYLNTYQRMLTEDDLDAAEQYLYSCGATLKQIIWRRYKIANSSLEEFNQEYGQDDISCFVNTSCTVFDPNLVIERLKYLKSPIQSRQLPAKLIPYRHYLKIFEEPQADKYYWFGVDVAEGVKRDNSVICGLDKELNQIFEFASNDIAPHIFTEILLELARWYNNAYLVIELASAGHIVISKIYYDFNYVNIHKHKTYDMKGRKRKKKGFETNSVTRPILISDIRESFDNRMLNINSKELLEEMKTFTMDAYGKIQGSQNKKDDRVMAIGLAIQGIKAGISYI